MDRCWALSGQKFFVCEMCGKQVGEAVMLDVQIKGEHPTLCKPCAYRLKRDLEDLEEEDDE